MDRDRKIFALLRNFVIIAELRHHEKVEPVEPLSVFYGKEGVQRGWELTPFPVDIQENGRPMPQWKDLSQWMKVMMATMLGHQWHLLTFNMHLHPELEAELVSSGNVREKLAERVRKHLSRSVGSGREFFFVIEGFSTRMMAPTFLHIHGAVCAYDRGDQSNIDEAIARAAGHNVRGRGETPRAVHTGWFKLIQVAYGNYLFKFAKKFDPRLDERRLVMSRSMTSAARDLWIDITRPGLRDKLDQQR